jgi:hypothetical protein
MQGYLGAQGAVVGDLPADDTQLSIERNSITKHQTTHIQLTNAIVPLADGPPGPAFGSKKIFEFGTRPIIVEAAGISVTVTKSSAGVDSNWDGDIGMGRSPANGIDGLTGEENDLFTSIATPQAVDGVTTVGKLELTSNTWSATEGPHDVYLNLLVDLNDHSVPTPPCNLIVNGFVLFIWVPVELGDG